MTVMNNVLKGLYLVTPDWDDTDKMLDATEAGLLGGAALVQYRHKTASPELRREQASALQMLCHKYAVPFIVNDFLDLFLELDADGIHVGGTDMAVAEVRTAIGPSKILGASCYGSLQMARDAAQAGASYVAFGGFYPSRVKKYEVSTPAEIVAQAKREIPIPNCVIGGMTQENSVPLIAQGAHMVAAISSVYMTDDPEASARAFVALFK
jgi:thiamine-phosphate pyrophosphorylase